MNMPNPRWADRTEFAETAEAIGVPTNLVMTVLIHPDGRAAALFTKTDEATDETMVYGAGLTRDADGILHATGERPFKTWGTMKKEMNL